MELHYNSSVRSYVMLPAATKLVVTDLSHLKPILESAASRNVEHESQVLLEP